MTKKGGALIEGVITVGQATMGVELISNVAWDWGTEGGEIRGYAINQTYLTYLTRRISRGQVTPYSPYSPKANLDPTQFVYYAHYGTKEDFKTLLHAKYEVHHLPSFQQ